MVGYLVNLGIPREVKSRCYNLYKLKIRPVETSISTVVVERLVDVLCLFILLTISFFSWMEKPWWLSSSVGHRQVIANIYHSYLGVGCVGARHCWPHCFISTSQKWKASENLHGFKSGLLAILQLKKMALHFLFHRYLDSVFLHDLLRYVGLRANRITGRWCCAHHLRDRCHRHGVAHAGRTGLLSHIASASGLVMIYQLQRLMPLPLCLSFTLGKPFIMILGGVISFAFALAPFCQIRKRKKPFRTGVFLWRFWQS